MHLEQYNFGAKFCLACLRCIFKFSLTELRGQTCGDDSIRRQFSEVAVLPVVNVFASAVITEQFVVITASVASPFSIVTSVGVLSHRRMPHERNVAADCQTTNF